MRLDQVAEPLFAKHETFQPRWAWPKKAYEAASADARLFTADDATLRLGVGKNMVRAIRFWGRASKVVALAPDPERPRVAMTRPTVFGEALFGPDGWDPYCEDIGTWWLLHWMFLAPPTLLPVWWTAFHELRGLEFLQREAEAVIGDAIEMVSQWDTPAPSAIQKDLALLLRTYAPPVGREGADDALDSPFRELGLVRTVDAKARVFRFVHGEKPSLPDAITLYAVLDFLARTDAGAHTVTVSRLATEPGAPGTAFKLSEAALTAALERATQHHSGATVTSASGITQLAVHENPAVLGTEVLCSYYGRSPAIVQAGTEVAGVAATRPLQEISGTGRRSGRELGGPPPQDKLELLEWTQDRIDAGIYD